MAVFDNLQELLNLLGDAPEVAELTLSRPGGEQITIKRPARPNPASFAVQPASTATGNISASAQDMATSQPYFETAAAASPADTTPAASATEVFANRVGIFHPAKPPIESGGSVASGQIVGYIEAIKLMNEVRTASAGTVAEQFVEDGMPVEYGQPLFRVRAQ